MALVALDCECLFLLGALSRDIKMPQKVFEGRGANRGCELRALQ